MLEVFFGDSPPPVGPSPAGNSPPTAGPPTGSDTGSPPAGQSDKWYPDYNGDFSLGKCVNEAPLPTGRPNYGSGEECCNAAYAGQASGVCLSSLSQGNPPPGNTPPAPPSDSPGTPTDSGPSPLSPRPTRQPVSPTSEAGMIISSQTFIDMESTLNSVKYQIDSNLFLYETPLYQWIESSVYRFDDFMESLYVMATEGVAEKRFYIGENDVENGHVFGLVNIAAFLAQSMKETIRYDACGKCLFGLFAACARVGSLYLLMYELDD